MKVQNITDIDKFFKVIDSCKGKVELLTGEGDRLNLKSKLSQYVSMANIFSNGEIPELEIIACTGERCGKKNGIAVLEQLRRELKPDKNGISADGRYELRTQNCLKQCRTSPNLLIDGKLYSGERLKNIKKLLNELE